MYTHSFTSDTVNKTAETCILLLKSALEDVKGNMLVNKFKNCYKHIETLTNYQKKYSVVSNLSCIKRKEKLDKLLLKIDNKRKIDVSQSNHGFGLIALDNINKYEEILRVAEDDMITENNAYNSEIGTFLKHDPITRSMPNLALALFVLNEAYTSSLNQSCYIESLPKNVDTYLYLTPKDIDILKSSQYLNEIVQQFCNICSHYCYFYRIFSQSKDLESCHFKDRFCFEDFRWAVSIVMSRNNAIPCNDGKSRKLALVPIWDMMNHQFGEVTTDFDDETRSLVFYSMQEYGQGEEICMDYGKRSTLQYFMYSGFVSRNNPHDTYPLKIGFNKQDTLYEKKRQILSKINIDCNTVTFNIDYLNGNVIDNAMTSYLTVMLLKTDELLTQLLESRDTEMDILEYGVQVKTEVVSFVLTRIKMNLSCVDRVIDKIDKDSVNDFRVECLELLRHEKYVLEQILSKILILQ